VFELFVLYTSVLMLSVSSKLTIRKMLCTSRHVIGPGLEVLFIY